MKKLSILGFTIVIIIVGIYFDRISKQQLNTTYQNDVIDDNLVTPGLEKYGEFLLDNVYHSPHDGDIHYNVYIPDDYEGSEPYALYFTLPGYQGLYFQGVGENVKTEDFGFTAQEYISKMIIVAPQLEDWQETSANKTIALMEYFLNQYNIDESKVYASGYSGGGETMSLVMEKRPDLLSGYLHCSSKWDGDYTLVIENETPVYIVIGENDEYYGSQSSIDTYNELYQLYQSKGLTVERINQILILDVKYTSYFEHQGITNQHGGGGRLFSHDKDIMGWLFSQKK